LKKVWPEEWWRICGWSWWYKFVSLKKRMHL